MGRSSRAWVLHPELKNDRAATRTPDDSLAEAVALGAALPGMDVIGQSIVRLPRAQSGTLFGSGKIAELKKTFHDEEIDLVLVDGPVSPVQQRNLEKAWDVKLLDRTGLILEIFSDRARTREGVLQVEMAALTYQRTRLVRAWTHLERQRGGLGFVGGPGETQIESDRRAIDEQLNRLKRQLSKVVKTRSLHRAARAKVPYPIVALVGYTNAGKSTLFNHVTGAEVMAKDMLFATLDPTMRAVKFADGFDVIMSDTVGFISNLPTELVASFRATLEEVTAADIIIHVRDIAHVETEAQAKDVETILEALGIPDEVPRLEFWNKIDLLSPDDLDAATNQADRRDDVLMGSSVTGEGLIALQDHIREILTPKTIVQDLHLGFADGRQRAWLFDQNVILSESTSETGYDLTVEWTAKQKQRYFKV